MKASRSLLLSLLIAGCALAAVLLLTVGFFIRIPTEGTTFALDWISIREGVEQWTLTYSPDNGLRIPPWSALLLLPLGQLPMKAGWGVVAFLTLTALTLCLPRRRDSAKAWIVGIFALTLAYPAIRTMVDGNVEFLILAGLALLEFGLVRGNPVLFAAGMLLAATKIQETWLLLLFLPLLAGKEWTVRRWTVALGVLALVGIPSVLWKGREWLASVVTSPFRGSIMDSSLLTTVQRLGGSPAMAYAMWAAVFGLTVFFGARYVRSRSRETFGFLLAASLLLAPYAAGNNLLILYAFGVVPQALSPRWEGILLAGLINLPYVLLPFRELQYWYSASYWTLVLGLAWLLYALRLRAAMRTMDREAGQDIRRTAAAEEP